MCGIVGYIGGQAATPIILNGLHRVSPAAQRGTFNLVTPHIKWSGPCAYLSRVNLVGFRWLGEALYSGGEAGGAACFCYR